MRALDDGSRYVRSLRGPTCLRLSSLPRLTTFLGSDALGLNTVGLQFTVRHAVVKRRKRIGF